MANSKIPNLNLSDTLNTQRLKFNQLLDSVGDVSTLTTTGTNVTAAVNELDAELGTISAGAMGTTASTVSGAIAELDGRLDSINTTELLSPRMDLTDAAATNTIAGKLEVGDSADFTSNVSVQGNLAVGGNTTMAGTLTVDGQVTFKAGSDNNIALGDAATDTITLTGEVNSNIIPDGNNDYDLGSETKQWRHVYVDGTVNADNLAADSATIANNISVGGTLDVTGDTTLSNTITVQDSAYITGNLDLGSNLDVAGNVNVTGTVVSEGALTVEDSAYVTGNLDIGGNVTVAGDTTFANTITVQDSAYVTGNVDIGGNVNVTGTVVSEGALTVEDSAYITGNLDVGGSLTAGTTTLSSAAVSDLTNNRIVVAGASGELEDDENLTWDGSTLDVTGDLSVSAGFTVGGTFTTTGVTRNAASYVIVNDGVAVANGNRAGLAVDRPSNDSAIIQWNELGDYWEAGTTAGVERLALQTDSAAFHNLYAGGTLTVAGDTTLKNTLTIQDSAYVTGDFVVGGNFTVNGTTTTINTTNMVIEDNVMVLNSTQTGTPATSLRSGLEVERGSSTNVNLQWNENSDYWEAAEDGSNTLGRVATSGWLNATAPISFSSSTGNISHDNTTRSDTTTAATLAHSDAFEVVDSIQSNSKGHITGVNTRTITLPAGAIPNDATITIAGGTDLETGGSFTTDQSGNETITLDHSNTTRSDTTSTDAPGYGGTFEAVTSVTTNATGHVTAIDVSTVTIPASDNTNTTYSISGETVSGGANLRLSGSDATTDDVKFASGGATTVSRTDANTITISSTDTTANETITFGGDITGSGTNSIDLQINANAVGANELNVSGNGTSSNFLRSDGDGSFTWATPTNTTYSAGNDLDLSGTTFNIESELNSVTSIATSASDFTFDISGDFTLNFAGNNFYWKDAGVTFEEIQMNQTVLGQSGKIGAKHIYEENSHLPPVFVSRGDREQTGSTQNNRAPKFIFTGGNEDEWLSIVFDSADNSYKPFGFASSDAVTFASSGEIGLFGQGLTGGINLCVHNTGSLSNAHPIDFHRLASMPYAWSHGTTSSYAVAGRIDIKDGMRFGQGQFPFKSIMHLDEGEDSAYVQIHQGLYVGDSSTKAFGYHEIRAEGDITAFYASDITLKENIEEINNAMDKIQSIRGVEFDWTDAHIASRGGADGYFVRKNDVGVIAQEIEQVLPQIVRKRSDGTKAVEYEKIVALLIQGMKELKAEVDEIKANGCNCNCGD